jgi:hypothetical protein
VPHLHLHCSAAGPWPGCQAETDRSDELPGRLRPGAADTLPGRKRPPFTTTAVSRLGENDQVETVEQQRPLPAAPGAGSGRECRRR